MRYALLVIFLASCGSDGGKASRTDASPITYTEPPDPKGGGETTAACNGVTVSGKCEGGKAIRCDVAANRLDTRDCATVGRECVLDVANGAVCTEVDVNPCLNPAGSTCNNGVATFCDTSGATDSIRTWKCATNAMTCAVDDCKDGAYCCGGDTQDCGEIDYRGVCESNVAKWCSTDNQLQVWDCPAENMNCEVDTCSGGDGAFCCAVVDDECERLGYNGECTSDTSYQYCFNNEIEMVTCLADRVCRVDAMGEALCVDPVAGCGDIDLAGTCDGNVVKWCNDGVLEEIDCTNDPDGDIVCEEDTCLDGAAFCCPP